MLISTSIQLSNFSSSEIESFSGTVHLLVDVLDTHARRIELAKLKVDILAFIFFRVVQLTVINRPPRQSDSVT